jgi:hypothetical protein
VKTTGDFWQPAPGGASTCRRSLTASSVVSTSDQPRTARAKQLFMTSGNEEVTAKVHHPIGKRHTFNHQHCDAWFTAEAATGTSAAR